MKAECLVLSGTDAATPSECAVNSLLHWKRHFIQRLIITAYNSKTSSVLVSFSQSLKTILGAASGSPYKFRIKWFMICFMLVNIMA